MGLHLFSLLLVTFGGKNVSFDGYKHSSSRNTICYQNFFKTVILGLP